MDRTIKNSENRMQRMICVLLGMLCFFMSIGIWVQIWMGYPFRTSVPFPTSQIHSAGGAAYSISNRALRDQFQRGVHARAVILENGRPLGPRLSSPSVVKVSQSGSHAFKTRSAYFSASDLSDPRSNGRTYSAVFPKNISMTWLWGSFGLLAVGATSLLWHRRFDILYRLRVLLKNAWEAPLAEKKRAAEVILTVAILSLLLLPLGLGLVFRMTSHRPTWASWLHNSTLEGQQNVIQPVSPTIKSIFNGSYTQNLAARFDAAFSGREALVRCSNEIGLVLLGETPPDSNIVVGRNGSLLEKPYLSEYYLQRPAKEDLAALASDISRLQTACKEKGMAFLVLITPSKVSLYPEESPKGWSDRFDQRPRAYGIFLEELRTRQIKHVDGHAITMKAKATGGQPAPLFPKGGIHWGDHAALLTANAVIDNVVAQGVPLHPIKAKFQLLDRPRPFESERDILGLANFARPWSYPVSVANIEPTETLTDKRPTAVFVGGSFTQQILYFYCMSRQWSQIEYLFYYKVQKRTFNGDASIGEWRPTGEVDFNREVFSSDILVLEVNEQALVSQRHLTTFVSDALKHLAAP